MTRFVGAGLAALLLAWVFGPAMTAPPLYDGIGFPDEPYRYVQRPAKTVVMPPPTEGHGTTTRTASGTLDQLHIFGAENPPQLQATIGPGELAAPPGCTQVTGDGRPLAPVTAGAPARSWGNVYRLSIACGSAPVAFTPNARSTILLRAPDARRPGPAIFYRSDPSSRWRSLTTRRIGNDNFRAPFAGPGDYVLVLGAGRAGGIDPLLIAGVVLLVTLIGFIVVVRIRRTHTTSNPADSDGPHSSDGGAGTDSANRSAISDESDSEVD